MHRRCLFTVAALVGWCLTEVPTGPPPEARSKLGVLRASRSYRRLERWLAWSSGPVLLTNNQFPSRGGRLFSTGFGLALALSPSCLVDLRLYRCVCLSSVPF